MTEKEVVDYHERQFKTPYRSTVAFDAFLSDKIPLNGGGESP